MKYGMKLIIHSQTSTVTGMDKNFISDYTRDVITYIHAGIKVTRCWQNGSSGFGRQEITVDAAVSR